ncbi:MAG: AmmeMemoRadiSam system radical SAM enzyme [Lachnospiraceae bacterium]|nr:AmmeMemoRadiSam system radical SAM enzyme [Lachnospiraceae bacterium]
MQSTCNVCFRHCKLNEGQTGACFARAGGENGETVLINYGHVTSIALDPIEKKPLYHFHPGSMILSVGSYGCNLKCPFCQNVSISLADNNTNNFPQYEYVAPETLVELAKEYVPHGNIGVAFTYNEPLVCYEYVRDTACLLKTDGLSTVVVTNGSVLPGVIDEIGSFIDAMNIDLKCFSYDYYKDVLNGDYETTKECIEEALKYCHVEITTLIIPGENDSVKEMEEMSLWIEGLEKKYGKAIPYHISRFFPRSRYADRKATDIAVMKELFDIASKKLSYVYLGNC